MKITIEINREVDLGWANGWGDLQTALYRALAAKAQEMGIKCVESKLGGRCCTMYQYPGVVRYRVDSTD